jgi:hypothetical protein
MFESIGEVYSRAKAKARELSARAMASSRAREEGQAREIERLHTNLLNLRDGVPNREPLAGEPVGDNQGPNCRSEYHQAIPKAEEIPLEKAIKDIDEDIKRQVLQTMWIPEMAKDAGKEEVQTPMETILAGSRKQVVAAGEVQLYPIISDQCGIGDHEDCAFGSKLHKETTHIKVPGPSHTHFMCTCICHENVRVFSVPGELNKYECFIVGKGKTPVMPHEILVELIQKFGYEVYMTEKAVSEEPWGSTLYSMVIKLIWR